MGTRPDFLDTRTCSLVLLEQVHTRIRLNVAFAIVNFTVIQIRCFTILLFELNVLLRVK